MIPDSTVDTFQYAPTISDNMLDTYFGISAQVEIFTGNLSIKGRFCGRSIVPGDCGARHAPT